MVMKFLNKIKTPAAEPEAAAEKPKAPLPKASTLSNLPKQEASAGGVVSWVKKGNAAKEEMVKADHKAEMDKAERGKLWRFWMPADSERSITFLDGEIDADGMIECPMFYEHNIPLNGERANFVCTAEEEGYCVICDSGKEGSKNALVGMLTVCDHSQHTIKKGQNAGKIIQNTRKLYVAKRETIKQLSKIAVKRGGLTGCTFDVTRGNDRTAAVGNQFDFVSKMTLDEIVAKYGIPEPEKFLPAKLEDEITYRTNAELLELGVGKAPTGPGYEKKASSTVKKVTSDEL